MDGNIQKYLSFVKTVEYGSFTKAAEMLNYSQSGISRMIHDLENDWNIILLERGKAGVKLTSDGMTLLPYAKNLISEYEKLIGEIDDLTGLRSGLIRVGATESAASALLPGVIAEYAKDYPGIYFDISAGSYDEITSWLEDGRIDLAISRLPAPSEYDSFFLTQDSLKAVIPSSDPLSAGTTVETAALCDLPFIMPAKSAAPEITALFEKSGLYPKIKYSAFSERTVLSMVKQGLGVSILPGLSLSDLPEGVTSAELDLPVYINLGLIVKNKRSASLAVKRIMDYFSGS